MPFPTNPALEKAVIADCENDLPRLVYADWLDENGDSARANFIRTQIALHDKHPADPDFTDLELTRDELSVQLAGREDLRPPSIDGLEFPWHLGLATLVTDGYFERGFPAVADGNVHDLVAGVIRGIPLTDALQRMLANTALRGLCFRDHWFAAGQLMLTREARAFTSLALGIIHSPGFNELEFLGRSPMVRNLRRFSLLHGWRSGALRTLAGLPFRKLTRLDLPPVRAGRPEINLFLRAEWVRRLRDVRLTVSASPPAESLVKGFAALPHLHSLTVTDCLQVSLAAFKKGGEYPAFGKLELIDANLRGDQADHLSACDFPRLAALGLEGNVPASAVRKLATADWFSNLRSLWINSGSRLGDTGVQSLRAASGLKSLGLYDPVFGARGWEVLSVAFPHLRSLELRVGLYAGPPIAATTSERFIGRLTTPHLRNLSLMGMRFDTAGATALANNPTFRQLTRLELRNASLSTAAVETLVTSPHLQQLIQLNLASNDGGDRLEPLLDPAVMPNLVECGVPYYLSDDLRKKLETARPGLRLV